MPLKLTATDVALAALPRGQAFFILAKGPDVYVAQPRAGSSVTIVAADGEIEGTVSSAVSIGPLATFFNPMNYGQAQHYATKNGSDNMALFDSLEAIYPKDKTALDPRTIYSQVAVHLPMLAMPGMPA